METWSLWLECNAHSFAMGSDTADRVALKASEQLDLWCNARLVDTSLLHVNVN
jgi:hypothetical protein